MAGESQAVLTARQFREQLVRQEDAALREMARHWVRMENDLMDQFQLLAQEVREMQERGEAVPPQAIYNLQRYQQMMAQIAQELPEYDTDAIGIITGYQRESYTLGLESGYATIMDTDPSDPMWNRVGVDAAEVAAGFAGNGAPLAQLMQRDYGDLGMRVTDALVSGVALGKGAFETAKDMRDAMGMEYNRSVRIARTEINRAYRIANADAYAKSGVVEKVLRLCAKQANTCLACLEMDGEECKNGIVDDHPNGRCTTVAVTIGGHYPQWQKGHDWLMEQDEETQRAIMGDGRYEMWKRNGINPRDMVRMEPNPIWGGSPTIISERDLRQRYNIIKPVNPVKPTSGNVSQPPRKYTFAEMMGNAYSGNKYTPEQMKQIQTLYEGMPTWLQPFYNKFGGELAPVLENKAGKVPRKNTDFGYFSSWEGDAGRVHFLPKRDAGGRSDQNPFELGAHEYGHNIDFLAGGKNKFSYLSNQYKNADGKGFLDIINSDFEDKIRTNAGKAAGEKITRDDINAFCRMIKDTYSIKERGCLSDMFENYSVRHGGPNFPFGIGHGTTYAKTPGMTEKEAFAEMLEAYIANPDALKVMEQYIPNALSAFREMIEKAVA